MDQQITLKYNEYQIVVSFLGAQLLSFKKNDHEYIWMGDKASWVNHAPILFPVCGGLNDGIYRYNDKEYPMIKHGFIRQTLFKLEKTGENYIELIAKDDEETSKSFPFHFSFIVRYELNVNGLSITYRIKNLDQKIMYFNVGGHEGYQLYDDLDHYYIVFSEDEELRSNIINGNLIERNTIDFTKYKRDLPLNYDYFQKDALVFQNIKSQYVSLFHKDKGNVVTIDFSNAKHLVLWSIPGAKFICIEPWTGIHDYINEKTNILNKQDVISLQANEQYEFKHEILVD